MKSQLIEMDICVTPVRLAKAKMIDWARGYYHNNDSWFTFYKFALLFI